MGKAKDYVEQFVGPELWEEIQIRVVDGQLPGQALINVGDHYDRFWSWWVSSSKIGLSWEAAERMRKWKDVARYLKTWGSVEDKDHCKWEED